MRCLSPAQLANVHVPFLFKQAVDGLSGGAAVVPLWGVAALTPATGPCAGANFHARSSRRRIRAAAPRRAATCAATQRVRPK